MIILLSGKQGSGKTSLAKGLLAALNCSYHLKFADPLYEMHEAIRIIAAKYRIPFEKKEGKLLQWLGTEWGRSKDPDVWVKAARSVVKDIQFMEPSAKIIIDDCRFRNEFVSFPSAIRIRLVADESTRKSRAEGWRDATEHPSEIALDDVPDESWSLVINTALSTREQTLETVLNFIKEKI